MRKSEKVITKRLKSEASDSSDSESIDYRDPKGLKKGVSAKRPATMPRTQKTIV